MNLYEVLSERTIKRICEYFNGDGESSIYNYRTGSALADMYSMRFRGGNYVVGVSRWCLCEEAMKFMAANDKLSEFFSTMLSFRNVKKERSELNDTEIVEKRTKAIEFINSIIYQDDYELNDVSGKIYFSKIDDLTNLVGEGGFARVYILPGTDKVIKKLKDEFKGNPSIVSRFKNEFAIITKDLAGIGGIIKAFDFDAANIAYTMEYCDTDLKKYINAMHSSIEPEKKIELVIEILSIIDDVHKRHVLHRDLSPKNIFMKGDKPIIADFGLGKAIDSNGRTYVTVDTSYQGTLEYCDPRQFQGLGFADEQSDIYSLGKIINFIMTKNSENFDHQLTVITTIATQTSLAARYHTVEEMIVKVKQSLKLDATGSYVGESITKIEQGIYDPSMDEYLLSFDGEDLIIKMYKGKFIKAFFNLFKNPTYDGVLITKLSSMHERLDSPIGLNFNDLDGIGVNLIKLLRDNKTISPTLKHMAGKCIFDIACGVNRWSVQGVFKDNYQKIESIYIQDSIQYLKEHDKLNNL